MTNTINLNIPLIAQNQAQKEVTANEAFSIIDAIINCGAVSLGINIPPESPDAGDLYILGSLPTGVWVGQGNNIAYYNAGWKFIFPNEGMTIWVNDKDAQYSWNGLAWVLTIKSGLLAFANILSANVSTSYDIDLNLADNFELTLEGNCNITFSNPPPAGKMGQFTLIIRQDGSGGHNLSLPTSVKWPGGVAPSLTMAADSVDILNFKTTSGGLSWYGRVDGVDVG